MGIIHSLNYWAIIVSGIAYWLIGSLWFSFLVKNIWSTELEKHVVKKIKTPTTNQLTAKMIGTFLLNLLTAFGISIILHLAKIKTAAPAIGIGLVLGIFIAGSAMWTSYIWENRSIKLRSIDVGYPIIGITVCSLILGLWH